MLAAESLALGFNRRAIINSITLQIERGDIVSIVGPNGSGKSTLLKGLSRSLKPMGGTVYLNGKSLYEQPANYIARQMAILPQKHEATGDITVRELVEYGRFPHQKWWQGIKAGDDAIVIWAMQQTGVAEFADRTVATLSGGELQRAWIAVALAQQPQILLLDEPTTYLDICHQLEIMELVQTLNRTQGITVVMVLHDLNHAAAYSKQMLVIKQGSLFTVGTPAEVINREMLTAVFGVDAEILIDGQGMPVIVARRLC